MAASPRKHMQEAIMIAQPLLYRVICSTTRKPPILLYEIQVVSSMVGLYMIVVTYFRLYLVVADTASTLFLILLVAR